MEDDKHSREVLISLRKRYSRDEAVAIIFRRLADTETELGIVKSERDEALHKIKCMEKEDKQEKILRRDFRERVDAARRLKEKVKELERENKHLIEKLYE